MAHRVDGVLVGYPIATPSLRISTRVPRDQRTPGPNSLGPVCPVPTVPSTARGTYKYVSLWSSARIRVAGSSQPPSRQPQQSYDARVRVEKNGFYRSCDHTRLTAGAEDIGTWSAIVDLMSYLAVIVNGLLLTYTGQFVVNNPLVDAGVDLRAVYACFVLSKGRARHIY